MIIDWSKIAIMIKLGKVYFRKQINGFAVIAEKELKRMYFQIICLAFAVKTGKD